VSLDVARDIAEKQDHANVCLRKLNIKYSAVIDGMDDKAEAAYSAWPSRVYLVRRDGRILYDTRLSELDFKASDLAAALKKSLARP